MPKHNKPKTLDSAERRIRQLEKELRNLNYRLYIREASMELLARLSAEGPAFYNPLHVDQAKTIRDNILRQKCHMNPDGSPLTN